MATAGNTGKGAPKRRGSSDWSLAICPVGERA